jgi:Protein of unknown function (DUF3788)
MPVSAKQAKSLSAFGDKSSSPTKRNLHRALGAAAPLWDDVVTHVDRTYAPVTEQWNFSSMKSGWSLRLRKGERIILYLIPQVGRCLVGIVLGGKAVAAAKGEDLPQSIVEAIAEAPTYAEGTGVRLPIAAGTDLPALERLVALKMGR